MWGARQTNIFEPVRRPSDRHENLAAIINSIRKVDISALEHSQLRLCCVGGILNEFNHAAIVQMLEVDFDARGDRRRRRLDHPQVWFFFGALDAAMNIVRFWFLMQTLASNDVYSRAQMASRNATWNNNFIRVIILSSFLRLPWCLAKKKWDAKKPRPVHTILGVRKYPKATLE